MQAAHLPQANAASSRLHAQLCRHRAAPRSEPRREAAILRALQRPRPDSRRFRSRRVHDRTPPSWLFPIRSTDRGRSHLREAVVSRVRLGRTWANTRHSTGTRNSLGRRQASGWRLRFRTDHHPRKEQESRSCGRQRLCAWVEADTGQHRTGLRHEHPLVLPQLRHL